MLLVFTRVIVHIMDGELNNNKITTVIFPNDKN